mmetsp:Transcript_8357/g.23180  ORF Transcript_8357/g.23180 Transcript_8357/m.23180 type:complete len:375 (-) Transcript_8357:57-1181(-)
MDHDNNGLGKATQETAMAASLENHHHSAEQDIVDDPLVDAAFRAATATEQADAAVAAIAATVTNHHANPVAEEDDDDDDYTKWNKNGYGAPVTQKKGKFSKQESELIRKSVIEFCAAKQVTTARLCSECDHKADLKGAWMEIAKRIPHRSVHSVYRHGIRQLHPFKRGAWSDAEVSLLFDLVARYGKKWVTIQNKLNRFSDYCRDKYREMSDDYVKGRWKEQETEVLKSLIRDIVGVSPSMEMKEVGRYVEEQGIQIPWSTITKRMGKRSRLSCFKKWQKMAGLGEDNNNNNSDANDLVGDKRKTGSKSTTTAEEEEEMQPHSSTIKRRKKGDASFADGSSAEFIDIAKMADSTIEAVGLPDARSSFVQQNFDV